MYGEKWNERAFSDMHTDLTTSVMWRWKRLGICNVWASASDSKDNPSMGRRVTVPTMTLAHKVDPGLQDLQTRARRILAEKNAEKAKENTWIGRMIAAKNINELEALIKSRDSV